MGVEIIIENKAANKDMRKKEGSLAQRLKSAYNLHFRPGSSSLFLDKDSRTHANPI